MNARQIPEAVQTILKKLRIDNPILLGIGGEGYVFTYTKDTVIKIYKDTNKSYLQSLEKLQALITNKNLPIATPQILKIGKVDATYYTLEKKLDGVLMEHKFPKLSEKEKFKLLKSYYEAMKAFNSIELPDLPFGNILDSLHKITDKTWPGFLIKMLHYKLQIAGERISKDVTNLNNKIQLLSDVIEKTLNVDKKSLVHSDYFINQVLVNENNEISAVLDISAYTLAGDKRLDVAGSFFFEDTKYYTKEHIQFLVNLAIQDYGENILKYNDIYRMYYCFYFSDVCDFWPEWVKILMQHLNDEKVWRRISQI